MTTAKAIKKPEFELVLERVIDAPRERVWQAWADPKQVVKWFAPKPYTLSIEKMDLRTGGSFSMAMHSPEGQTHAFSGTYPEIDPPSKIVWTGEFPGDPKGNMRTEIHFDDLGKRTKVRVRQTFQVLTPINEQPTKGAKQGWTMTLNQLAEVCEA